MCYAITCICQHAPTPYTSLIEAGQDCFPRWAEGWLEEPLFFSSSCCCTWQTSTQGSLQTARPATQPPLSLRLSLVNLRSRRIKFILYELSQYTFIIHFPLPTSLLYYANERVGVIQTTYCMNIVKRCFFLEFTCKRF